MSPAPHRRIARITTTPGSRPDELRLLGRSLRQRVSRTEQGTWTPPADRADPVAILAASNESRVSELTPIRIGRMMADPFAYLRGSAEVMAADLATTPSTGLNVQICGDLHLVNFGVFASAERQLLFDVNDFDETLPGPWEWDVKRLAASLVVAARVSGHGAAAGRDAVLAMAEAYRTSTTDLAEMSALDRWYVHVRTDEILERIAADRTATKARLTDAQAVLRKARRRTGLQAMAKLTTRDGPGDALRIVDDPPIVERITDEEHRAELAQLLVDYRRTLDDTRRHLFDEFRLVDVARKVVGVGSVGTRAYVALLLGPNDGPLFLQMKEAGPSALEDHVGRSSHRHHGQRVVAGQRWMQASSDVFLGWARMDGRDYYVRQLRDMKGSADPASMSSASFPFYGRLCGRTAARAHARSSHPATIAAYLGRSDRFDQALVRFAEAYADQTERDHATLVEAVAAGRIDAVQGV